MDRQGVQMSDWNRRCSLTLLLGMAFLAMAWPYVLDLVALVRRAVLDHRRSRGSAREKAIPLTTTTSAADGVGDGWCVLALSCGS